MGLVAFPPESRKTLKVYIYWTAKERWEELANIFTKEAHSLFGMEPEPLLNHALQTGIPVLQTIFCDVAERESDDTATICPTCDERISALGEQLPKAHLVHTQVTCMVTGE